MDSKISKKTIVFNQFRKILRNKVCESLLYPFTNNKPLSNLFVKFIPGNDLYKTNSIRLVKRNGINFKLDISDYQNWLIYFGVNNDASVGLFELVKPNSTIIDVGANIAQTSLKFAQLVGEKGAVIGFEPDKLNYQRASDNLKLNSFKNIVLHNFALGEKTEEVPLKINSPQNRGGNRLDRKLTNSQNIVKVEKLDIVINQQNIATINLIKIDVEGFELEVLKGAKETINKFKPILFIEMDDRNLKEQNASADELLLFLKNNNYSIKRADTNEPIDNANSFRNCSLDIIAYPNN